jgi:type IV pilus assembly PilM-like protein/type IV pilus assembly PilN-like protein
VTVAIDFGKGSVKVLVQKGGTQRVASADLDPSLKGEARQAALSEAARSAGAALGIKPGTTIHAGVPRALAIVKSLTLPDVPAEEIEPLLRFQAAKVLPFPLTELSLAWANLGPEPHGGGQRYALGAVHQDTLSELRALIEDAGYKTGRLEISSQAAARAIVAASPSASQGEVLLLDVGHTTTDVMLIEEGTLRFSRSATVGASSEGCQERLGQEVVRSLVAARTEAGASERVGPPDKLLVSGGGSRASELVRGIGALVRTQAEAVGPENLSDAAGAPISPENSGPYLVVGGLVGEAGVVPRLDFAGRAQAQEAQRGRNRTLASVVGAVLVLVLGIGGLELYLDGLEAEVIRLEGERAQLDPSVKRAKSVRAELRRITSWDARKGRELEALHAVSQALPDQDRAYLTQLRWTDGQAIRIVGRAKDGAAAESFFSALEEDPRVASARVEQIRAPRGKARGVEFSGQVRLVDPQRTGGAK